MRYIKKPRIIEKKQPKLFKGTPLKIKELEKNKIISTQYYKGIAYTQEAKNIIHTIPGIMTEIKKVITNQNSEKIIQKKGENWEYKIQKIPKNELMAKTVRDSPSHIILETKINGKSKKYFLKAHLRTLPIHYGINGVSEIKAIEILKQNGIEIIPAHFAMNFKYKNKNYTIIAYEYIPFPTLSVAIENGAIRKETAISLLNNIKGKVYEINKKIKPYYIWDIKSQNIFIDLKTKKLYVFDPALTNPQNSFQEDI